MTANNFNNINSIGPEKIELFNSNIANLNTKMGELNDILNSNSGIKTKIDELNNFKDSIVEFKNSIDNLTNLKDSILQLNNKLNLLVKGPNE